MTSGVCTKCGEIKHLAFMECPKCKHKIRTDRDKAEQALASEHYHNGEHLQVISNAIKARIRPMFDRETLKEGRRVANAEGEPARVLCTALALMTISVALIVCVALLFG